MTAPRHGGRDRVSTKARNLDEIRILGLILTEARRAAGIRQSEVAERLGMPASYLSKIENGTRRVDVIELLAIAEAIGTDAAELVRELGAKMRTASRGKS